MQKVDRPMGSAKFTSGLCLCVFFRVDLALNRITKEFGRHEFAEKQTWETQRTVHTWYYICEFIRLSDFHHLSSFHSKTFCRSWNASKMQWEVSEIQIVWCNLSTKMSFWFPQICSQGHQYQKQKICPLNSQYDQNLKTMQHLIQRHCSWDSRQFVSVKIQQNISKQLKRISD